MGHEFIGVVEAVGAEVRTLKPGDLVVARSPGPTGPASSATRGCRPSCLHGGFFGGDRLDGGQAEAVRVPQADGTLFVLPVGRDDALMPSLLTLSDVMGTGPPRGASRRGSRRAGRRRRRRRRGRPLRRHRGEAAGRRADHPARPPRRPHRAGAGVRRDRHRQRARRRSRSSASAS